MKQSQREQSSRTIVFRVIALALPVLFFGVLELGLRLADYGGNLDLFISSGGDFTEYYICNPRVGRRYFFMQNTVPSPPNDIFLKQKPENGYRIFVLGGSTTAGYPYGPNLMFSRILQRRLSDVFPEKRIEVVNTAMTAVNSYTMVDFMSEIVDYQPDAILIYAGHNEFYGALGAASTESLGRFPGFIRLYLKLQKFKTFLLIRDGIGQLKRWFGSHGSDKALPATLMERIVAEQTIPYKSELYKLGKQQFEGNLRHIFQKAQEAGIRVVVSELVSNIRDLEPFVSVAMDSFPPADEVYRRAERYEKQGDWQRAKETYFRAKDLDALRFRAAEEFNRILHTTANEFDVPVVAMKSVFEAHSPNGLIGDALMVDHLHPNSDGYFLMAEAFFETMRSHGLISPSWPSDRIKSTDYYRKTWGMTALDSTYAALGIRLLKSGWPFQPRSFGNKALSDYQPETRVDSLALNALFNDAINMEKAHRQLAEFYARRRQFQKAFAEYNALIATAPYMSSYYLHAADMLIKSRQIDRALPYLLESLERKTTGFALKWVGQIYLAKGNAEDALPFLEQAISFGPRDPQLLYNLCVCYIFNQKYNLARSTFNKLQKVSPGHPGLSNLERLLESK